MDGVGHIDRGAINARDLSFTKIQRHYLIEFVILQQSSNMTTLYQGEKEIHF